MANRSVTDLELTQIFNASEKYEHAHPVQGGWVAADHGEFHVVTNSDHDIWVRRALKHGGAAGPWHEI